MNMNDNLEARIERLEAIADIERLKALGMYHADRKDAEGFAQLFCEDGVFHGVYQKHVGRKAIAAGLKFFPFAIHYATNPIITVRGASAYGRWYTIRPQIDHAGKPSWAAGWYDDEYVKVDGRWLFKSVRIGSCFQGTYEEGWIAEAVTPPAALEQALAENLRSNGTAL